MTRRSLTFAAFAAVLATAMLRGAQGAAGPGAARESCAVQVREFPLPAQIEGVSDLDVDVEGNLIVAGLTSSPDFPTTAGAVKAQCGIDGDAFVMVLTPEGGLRYSTCLGGDARESSARVLPAADGALWVVTHGFSCCTSAPCYHCVRSRFHPELWRVKPGSPAESWRTFVPEPDGVTVVDGIAAGLDGSLWLLATTEAPGIRTVNAWQPTLAGDSDALLARYTPGRPDPVLLTYLGGSGSDYGQDLVLAPDGDPIVEGWFSPDFMLGRMARSQPEGSSTGYGLTRVDVSGRWLEYATSSDALGVSGPLVVDREGHVMIAGRPHRSDSPPPDVARARQHEIGLAVVDGSGNVRSSALLDDGLDQFTPLELNAWVSHVALVGRGLVLVVGSYWAEDIISGGFFANVTDAAGSWPRRPFVVERPSTQACVLEAATSRGRDVYVAGYEWPPIDARRKIVVLRLRPGADEAAGAGAGHDRR